MYHSDVPADEVAFFDSLATYGGAPALIDRGGQTTSYAELLTRVENVAAELGPVRRLVFLEAATTVAAIAAYLACLRGRHPVCLCSPEDRSKTRLLIDRYRPNAVIVCDGDRSDLEWQHRDGLDLHSNLAVLLSTSGSTGSSKFVKLSRTNIDSNARAIAEYLGLGPGERALTTLKFSYSYGMSVVNSHLATGGALVLTDLSVTDAPMWAEFRSAGATSFAGVPYTFEALHQSHFAFETLPSLRYVTQAGGRLAPELVRYFATIARSQGWRFFVMYGQTEAAPRMTYLPPAQALVHPDSIGMPIPGGRIELLDEAGRVVPGVDAPGQIAYSGPNVMMGYAERTADLALDQTPPRLLSGDIARRDAAGLFYIVGRTARFVKPFGLRVNLDDLEAHLQQAVPGARCAGTDDQIVIAITTAQRDAATTAIDDLSRTYHLPVFLFRVVTPPAIPLLPTGKVDYQAILAIERPGAATAGREPVGASNPLRIVFSRRFAREFWLAVGDILGFGRNRWQSVEHIYRTLLAAPQVRGIDTFRSLAGDSLSYVQVMMALEEYLGALPADWQDLAVRDLEAQRQTAADVATA